MQLVFKTTMQKMFGKPPATSHQLHYNTYNVGVMGGGELAWIYMGWFNVQYEDTKIEGLCPNSVGMRLSSRKRIHIQLEKVLKERRHPPV